MDNFTKEFVWSQFGAAIDTMENAINACPEEIWSDQKPYHQYWYVAYHTIFWMDYYLSESYEDFKPPQPYTMSEFDPSGLLPERVYTQAEMLSYLGHCSQKARNRINALNDESMKQFYDFKKYKLNIPELLLYTMRHIQHHAAQMNLILRQRTDSAPGWMFTSKVSL